MTKSNDIRKKQLGRLFRDNNSVLILVILFFVAFVFIDGFTGSFYNVIQYSAVYGISCIGLALVMLTGNIDLSVGYMAASCGVCLVMTFNKIYAVTASAALALICGLIVALVVGAVLGCFNGLLVTKVGISPLIATIATNYIYQGFVFNFAKTSFPVDEKTLVQSVAKTKIFGLKWLSPMVIVFLVFIALVFWWMYKTRFGNRLHVVGDNPEAAGYAGISVSNTVWVTYILCGLFAAITGFMMISFNGYTTYTQGEYLATFPISCCVIGGIKMSGGKGTAIHVLLGVIIMRCISTMMSTMFWSIDKVNLVTGLLLVGVLLLDRFTGTKKEND